MKTQLFLLLLALSVLSTQAQSLSIKGRVTDASQEAVIAANVSLWTIDSTLVTGVTSDAQGKFALHKIKAGDYRLSISFIGLQSENILLKLNKSLDLGDVQLQEDAVSLGEVTVSASTVLQRVDRQIILPSESHLKRSFGAYDKRRFMKRYAKTALWITFGLLFGLTIVKVSTLMYEIYSFMHS